MADGGIAIVEVTLRNKTALESLANIHRELPDLVVGAGTVTSPEQASLALEAGADFIVSPGINPATIKFCQEKGLAIVPGAATATELELGVCLVLTFSSSSRQILRALCLLSKRFADLLETFDLFQRAVFANMKPYVEETAIFAIGGSFLTPQDAIASSDWAAITKIAERAVDFSWVRDGTRRYQLAILSTKRIRPYVGLMIALGLPREIDISFCWRGR